ncbi:MAG: ankyrin repeat domain-containing protein [Candidatus Poribacteria bacterium]|nr:ankyrin repeat domain-containing protein [Candidatus Poribacteria bacterium]
MPFRYLFQPDTVSILCLKKMSLAFSFLLASILCLSIIPAAQGFITFDHEFRRHFNVLVDKVHDPHWDISYAYGDDCPPEDRNNDAALTAAVSKALRTWLQPLRDYTARPIVNDFRYQRNADNADARIAADLWIIFHCEQRNSTAHIGGNSPGINLRDGTKVVRHFMTSLVHETGHIFGLVDTYIPWADRHKQGLSKGGLALTKGTQPAAVMSQHIPGFPVAAANDPVPLDGLETLGIDDSNGIVWLYKHVHEGLPLENCFFPNYELEETPHGCRPKYPLIFEIKQGDDRWALRIIDEDSNIDVNAQDKDGLTALHHAVLNGFEELVAKLIAHKNIKPFLRDKQGRTALKLARERELDKIIVLLLSHPLTLSVDAKGKLATTWGRLKQ